jgi:hypothetical protein
MVPPVLRRFFLLSLLLPALTACDVGEPPDDLAPSQPSAAGARCASQASDQCPFDQPLFVTCSAGAIFDAGSLTCSAVYPSGASPGLCCGACDLTPDASVCDGSGLLSCTTPYQYNTTGCTALLPPDAGLSAPLTWCCP